MSSLLPRANEVSRTDVGGQVWTPFSIRFSTRNTLLAATLYVLAYQIAVSVVLFVNNAYDMTMFTLWSFTIFSAFTVALLVSLFVEHLVFTLAILFALPIVMGNVVFVAITIVIIIANNSEVLTKGTACEQPTPPPNAISMSAVHTGDAFLHPFMVFNLFVMLLAGGAYFSKHIIVRSLRSFPPWAQWLYFVFWMCASLVFMLTPYQLSFNVAKKYPTSFSPVEREFIMLGVLWLWMLAAWFIFTADHETDRQTLASTRVSWLPSVEEMKQGRLTGLGAPSTAHHEWVISAEAIAQAAEL